jgi:hypothetical protein
MTETHPEKRLNRARTRPSMIGSSRAFPCDQWVILRRLAAVEHSIVANDPHEAVPHAAEIMPPTFRSA